MEYKPLPSSVETRVVNKQAETTRGLIAHRR